MPAIARMARSYRGRRHPGRESHGVSHAASPSRLRHGSTCNVGYSQGRACSRTAQRWSRRGILFASKLAPTIPLSSGAHCRSGLCPRSRAWPAPTGSAVIAGVSHTTSRMQPVRPG